MDESFDAVVVGSGPAGSTVATLASQEGRLRASENLPVESTLTH